VRSSTNGTLDEAEAIRYVAAASDLFPGTAATGTANRYRDATLAFIDNSSRFDLFIKRVVDDESANLGLERADVPVEMSAQYLFYVRSGFFGLFMGGNPSVAGMQRPPVLSGDPGKRPFVSYSSLRARLSADELERNMAFFFGIHRGVHKRGLVE
jgi:hypothetical protein